MNCLSHRRLATAFVCTAGLLSWSCGYDPTPAPREYALNPAVVAELEETGVGESDQGQLLGALTMLFGTPSAPKYLVTSEWVDDGFNPNWPQYAEGDNGSGSISDLHFEGIEAGNSERFAAIIKLLEAGEIEQVADELSKTPRGGILEEWWQNELSFLADDASDEDRATFAADAIGRFVGYYPSFQHSAELYRQQCLHCHGNEGGADGPTAPFLDPLPRDYRRGIFKYTALKDKARPRREDLFNILTQGVYTTAMPNFRRFSDAELHGLVDYVQLLSIRGETEMLIAASIDPDGDPLTPEMVQENYDLAWSRWRGQDEKLVTYDGEIPAVTQDLLDRGKELFNNPNKGNCMSCHGESGRGDGVAAWEPMKDDEGNPLLDDEGEPLKNQWTGLPMVQPVYKDDWGHPIVPRDLTRGVFRFGRRPIDIYRRIYSGINGTPMPAIGEAKDADGNPLLSDEDMWALVHYVRSLSVDEEHPAKGLLPLREVQAAHDDHHGHGDDHGGDGHDDDQADSDADHGGDEASH